MAQSLLGDLLLADVVSINVGVSLVLGSLASNEWLRDADSPWTDAVRERSKTARGVGLVATLLGLICAVWFQATVMGDAPLLQSGPTALVLLRDTHFGHAALAGLVAWCVVAALSWGVGPHGRVRLSLAGCGLAALVWSRRIVRAGGED